MRVAGKYPSSSQRPCQEWCFPRAINLTCLPLQRAPSPTPTRVAEPGPRRSGLEGAPAGGGARAQVRWAVAAAGGASARRSSLCGSQPSFSFLPPALVIPLLCVFPRGWGALTRCASSSAPECPACSTARTWWRSGGALPDVSPLLSARLLGSPRTASVAGLSSGHPALGPFALGFGGHWWHRLARVISLLSLALPLPFPKPHPPRPGACLASHWTSHSFATHPPPPAPCPHPNWLLFLPR